jgi:hypothetical protein
MAQLSGQFVITGIDQFPDVLCIAASVKAHPSNSDVIWVGNDGADSVASGTGYPLSAGESTVLILDVGNLNTLYTVANSPGTDQVCWLIVDA